MAVSTSPEPPLVADKLRIQVTLAYQVHVLPQLARVLWMIQAGDPEVRTTIDTINV